METRTSGWHLPIRPPYLNRNRTLFLHVAPGSIDWAELDPIARSHSLKQKSGLHVTLIGSRHAKRLRKLEDNVISHVRSLIRITGWRFRILPECFLIEKEYPDLDEQRAAIVQAVEIPTLDEFLRQVTRSSGVFFGKAFPHITLYSGSTNPKSVDAGIGIDNEEALRALSPKMLP